MLEWHVRLAGSRVVQDRVAVGERPALGVLAGQTDRNPFLEQGGERESLRVPPVDSALVEGVPPALELLGELRIDVESVRDAKQLLVELADAARRAPR